MQPIEREEPKVVDLKNPNIIIGLCLALTAIALCVVFFLREAGAKPADALQTVIPGLAASLGVVALLVERVIELFVTVWRDPAADVLEQRQECYEQEQARCHAAIAAIETEQAHADLDADRKKVLETRRAQNLDRILDLFDKAQQGEEDLVQYRAKTRRLAGFLGLGIGVLASAVGFRVLEHLVKIDGVTQGTQKAFFYVVDALLTGTLLAGGSLAVHQVFALYDAVMNASQKQADKLTGKG